VSLARLGTAERPFLLQFEKEQEQRTSMLHSAWGVWRSQAVSGTILQAVCSWDLADTLEQPTSVRDVCRLLFLWESGQDAVGMSQPVPFW